MKRRILLLTCTIYLGAFAVMGQKPAGADQESKPPRQSDPQSWSRYTVKDEEREKIYTGKEVDTKAQLVSKPEPSYTEEARMNGIAGTVILKVVLSAQGTVTNIRVVQGLPHGLTERAIAAARKIKFIPATKDGRYVSMWMQLEYNFSLTL